MKYSTLTGKNEPTAPSKDRVLIRRGAIRSDDLWWAEVLGRWVPAFEVHIGNDVAMMAHPVARLKEATL